jgi:predicted acylesterase/phospholipase RssA
MAARPGKEQFEEEVFPAELQEIADRRQKDLTAWSGEAGIEVGKLEDKVKKLCAAIAGKSQPSTSLGLVGLALSGGGIRSATESLGVLQALARHDVLKEVDYLSTVSGGGYIGACVTALLTNDANAGVRPAVKPAAFPLGFTGGENEAPAVQHLRAYSNYLAPQHGLFKLDTWRMVGWYIGTLIFNLLAPLFAAIFLLTLGTLGVMQLWRTPAFLSESLLDWVPYLGWLLVVILLLYVVCFWRLYRAKIKQTRDLWSKGVGYAVAVISLPAFLFAAPDLYSFLVSGTLWAMPVSMQTFTERLELVGLKQSGEVVVQGKVSDLVTALRWSGAWTGRGPETRQQIVAGLSQAQVHTSLLPADSADLAAACQTQTNCHSDWSFRGPLTEVMRGLDLAGLHFGEGGSGLGSLVNLILALLAGIIPAAYLGYVKKSLPVFAGTLAGLVGAVLLVHFLGWLHECHYPSFVSACVLSAFLTLICGYIDINANSLLNFYRDRLADCYLIKQQAGGVAPYDSLKLEDVLPHQNGPYHLLNATLNLSGSTSLWLRGRMADMFLFSKKYCGSHRAGVGYAKTTDYLYEGKSLELADAMAISAAAFNSQMGQSTSQGLAVLLALLNVRLGRWLANPNPNSRRQKSTPVWWQKYFVKELFSLVDEKDEFVLLTDGGHFDNTGVYPLLQRRCATIIAVDNGADPERKFEDLAGLLRKARIDLGITIDLDLDRLHGNAKTRWAKRGFAAGTIAYPAGETGRFLYLKPTLTGKESEDILEYWRKHPTFPQQTTLDQFFDEAQFESYRELGYQITKQAVTSNWSAGGAKGP